MKKIKVDIKRLGWLVEGHVPFMETTGGLMFHGLPGGDNAQTFRVISKDIEFRYLANRGIPQHKEYTYKIGDIVVEVGAYLGFYSMYIAQQIGKFGRVLAIELIPNLYDILKLNLQSYKQAIAINKGVSDIQGVVTAYQGPGQICSLREDVVARFTEQYRPVEVVVDTLDNILDENDVGKVDMMIIQINGSEVKALEGLDISRVKNFAIAAPYGTVEQDNVAEVNALLRGSGFDLIVDRTMIFAKNGKFV